MGLLVGVLIECGEGGRVQALFAAQAPDDGVRDSHAVENAVEVGSVYIPLVLNRGKLLLTSAHVNFIALVGVTA